MSQTARMPPLFVSHGAPMSATDTAWGAELRHWASELPRPANILVISAHWQEAALTRGSTASRPKLLRDFETYKLAVGRPELESIPYDAPGASELAYEVASLLPVNTSNRGWDHGVWAPLAHMFPSADIPVLELSLLAGATPRRLFGLGRKLGVLASRGTLILGSGGITHNVAEMNPNKDGAVPEWARAFDGWCANLLADAEMEDLLAWRSKAPDARRAHPTSEHLDPLFVVAGAASLYDHAVGFPIRGFEHGTLSRRCIQFGRTP